MLRCHVDLRAICTALLCLLPLQGAEAQARFALLIANQDYAREVGTLDNPINDVRLMAKALGDIGFSKANIRIVRNADRVAILAEVADYARRLGAAGTGAIGFFYYSGHGAANDIDRRNYIIPVGAGRLDDRVWFKSVALDAITRTLSTVAPNAAHFVVFDACRNVLKLPTRGAKGFQPVRERRGMLIAFSTEPGQTASDIGRGSGPYAAALARELRKPGLDHLDVFQNVKERVYRETRVQVPWTRDGLLKRVTFAAREKPKVAVQKPSQTVTVKPKSQRLGGFAKVPQSSAAAAWQYAKESKSCAVLRAFDTRFANTVWSDFAKERMRQLACPTVVARKDPEARQPAGKKPAVGALPWTPQASAAQLRNLQAELKRLGCYDGEIDGQWGAKSMAALAAAKPDGKRGPWPLARLTARDADDHVKRLKKLPGGHCASSIARPVPATPVAPRGEDATKVGAADRPGAKTADKKRCKHVFNEESLQDEKAPFMKEVCE